MWTPKRSLWLSRMFTLLFLVLVVVCLCTGPWIVAYLRWMSPNASEVNSWFFYATIYTGGIMAVALLLDLYRLLTSLGKSDVFVPDNEKRLRRISWWCFAGALITGVSAIYYLPWLAVALAAAFAGLVVRVVKNIVAQAIHLKEENDFTI